MSRPRLIEVTSIDQLGQYAAAWNDLWLRSDVTIPTVRAELVCQWLETFRPESPLQVLMVEDQGQLVAALPLVEAQLNTFLRVGGLPSNEWTHAGDLLVDPQADTAEVMKVMTAGLARCPWKLLWLDAVELDAPRWQEFVDTLQRSRYGVVEHERFSVGMIEITNDWSAYQQTRSSAHRKKINRQLRRWEQEGGGQFQLHTRFAASQVESLMKTAFDVEDRGWKGRQGTSVLKSPGLYEFYLRQARLLAEWELLNLAFLESDGRPIAFEYGWTAKSVYHSYKIGYDEIYARYSPGHLLFCKMLRRLAQQPDPLTVNCMGPLDEATSKWTTRTQRIGRLVVGPQHLAGRLLLTAYRLRRMIGSCKKGN